LLAPAVLQKDSDLRYTVDDLQKKFDDELQRMNRKAKDVRKGRFTLGDEVTKLHAGEGVDALLFVRAEGQVADRRQEGVWCPGHRRSE